MSIELRDYQDECLTAVWNEIQKSQTALVVASTGSGKSRIIAALCEKSLLAKPDIKILVLFNKVLLLNQQANGFRKLLGSDKVSIYCGTEGQWDLSGPVVVGSIQSLDPEHLNFNMIVVDESHAVHEENGRYISFLKHQMQQNPKTKVVGFTATPYRKNGYIYGKGKFFSHPCFERGLLYFINKGFLVPPIAKQPDFQIDLSKLRTIRGEYHQEDIDAQTLNFEMARDQVSDALNRSQGRQKIVWACSSINHAELIRSLLENSGEKAVTLHSKMSWDDRDKDENLFMNGDYRHLTFVSVVSEGWDFPATDCIVLMRPTKSPGLMVQICGRGLRPWESKQDCLILDYANVISTMGPLEDPVIGKKSKKGDAIEPSLKTCPECRCYVPPRVVECPQCGFNWPKIEATKINLTADENVNFFSKSTRRTDLTNTKISLYTSKNGNECFRVEYIPRGFMEASISEYFAYKTDFGWRKFLVRAIELGIDLTNMPNAIAPITKKPSSIEYVMEGKYAKVKRLIFERRKDEDSHI